MEMWKCGGIPKMHTVLPEMERGDLRLVHRSVSEHDAQLSALRYMSGGRGMVWAGDTYATLYRGGMLWMSEAPDERRGHARAIRAARGECLVGGLGLGMVALAMALKDEVKRVDVVEIDQEIIELVMPHLLPYAKGKINVIHADLMEWKPAKGQAWDVLWFDIWPTLCTDDLADHAKLNRRYARRTRVWRGCWGHDLLLRCRREEKRRGGWWGGY